MPIWGISKTEKGVVVLHKMLCPRCGKRAFDVSYLPERILVVEMKCPSCFHLVKVPCGKEHAPKTPPNIR